MTALGLVDGTRVVASRTEKCWAASVSLKTIGALGPPGLLSARGAQEASAAAPATPAAAPKNRRRSMRSSSAFTASSPHCPRLFTDDGESRRRRARRGAAVLAELLSLFVGAHARSVS